MRNVCTTFKKIIPALVSTVLALTGISALPASAANGARAAQTGVSYTDSEALAALVYETQAGNCNLYKDTQHSIPAILPLDTSLNTNINYYLSCGTKPYSIWGMQCYIYAQGVFAHLFDEMPYHGTDNGYSYQHCTSVMGSTPTVSFDQFLDCEIMPGAYMRTTPNASGAYSGGDGHSLIILAYNSETVTVQEGNANNKGLIRLSTKTWDEFNSSFLSGKGRYVAHVVQPCDYYYESQFGLSYDFSKNAEPVVSEPEQTDSEPEQLFQRQLDSTINPSLPTQMLAEAPLPTDDDNTAEDAVQWESLGDVDGSGSVDADDSNTVLLTYLNHMVDGSLADEAELSVYDIDNSGALTADDADAVLRYYLSAMLSGDVSDAETLWKEILA